ncbi:transposase [Sinorhizobium fredii]|uniref:transposase n=1 Tax=Rhizobium fredii TaxID=380 RepID=UPI003517682D
MTEEQELALITSRVDEIRAGLDSNFTEEQLQRPLSRRIAHALIASVTAATAAKLTALSARVERLEAGGVKYCGTWQRALEYGKGSAVTANGALWVALRDTAEGEQPGKVVDAWQLAAKGGKPMQRTPEETRSV